MSATRRGMAAVAALWFVVLGRMIVSNEIGLRTGREVLLKTVPVDPQDLFRGDYVVLSYDISRIDTSAFGQAPNAFSPGAPIYVLLGLTGPYSVVSGIQRQPPKDGLFLKGRVHDVNDSTVRVQYGIESYFVPEGQGRRLERLRDHRLDVRAAIDHAGTARIKSVLLDGQPVDFSPR
jgi:uncharacterized membrane-anchored protein